jgi:uncharacterized membrane protein (UPF0127 family)
MLRWWFAILALLGVGVVGCERNSPAPASPATVANSSADPALPTHAQSRLETTQLWLGSDSLETELARTWEQERTGMMFRTNMAETEAMLFFLPAPQRASFWMAQTTVPLSAAYIDPNGAIVEIHDLKPLDTNAVLAASDQIQFVLETRQGWFQRHNVHEGMLVRGAHGTLMDLYRGQRK